MKIAYTNTKPHPVHIGSKIIMPNETREVDSTLVPDYQAPEPAVAAATDDVAVLLEKPVKEILPELTTLTDSALHALEAAEKGGKGRKGLLEAIATELLARANQGEVQILDLPLEQLLEAIKDPVRVPDAELALLYQAEENGQVREDVLEAISEEEARRAA